MLATKFQFIWPSGFRREDFKNLYRDNGILNTDIYVWIRVIFLLSEKIFLEIKQSETRIACGGHVCKRIGTEWAIFIEDLPQILPTKFRFIWPSGFIVEDFLKLVKQKQELPVATMFVYGPEQHEQSL